MLTPSLLALQGWKLRCRLRRERRSFAVAKLIVTHSKAHAEEIKKLYSGIVEPVVVHHGVGVACLPAMQAAGCGMNKSRNDNVAPLCERMSNEDGVKNNPRSQIGATSEIPISTSEFIPTFLVIGTPDRRKGFDRIQPVLESYASKYGPCRCVIVGGAKQTTDYGLRTTDRIVIEWKLGLSAEELACEFAGATVYLHLARYESFGIPLVEAASHGTPIVSTRVGIAPELLSGALAAYLVDGNDIETIAETLHRAGENRALVGEKVSLRYVEGFTQDCMTTTFLAGLKGSKYD